MATIHGTEATAGELAALALTGYGHFTSMHIEEGAVRGLDLHLDRLVDNAKAVFDAVLDRDMLLADVRAAIDGTSGTYTLRVTIFDPAINLGNIGATAAQPVPLMTTRPSSTSPLPPMRVKTVAFRRDTPEIKHVGLFSPLHHRASAKKAGFDDTVFVDPISTNVSEGSTWNIGFVTPEGSVLWPEAAVLPGVTMALLRAGGGHLSRQLPLGEVALMRAAFATNAGFGVRPISAIDSHDFDPDDPVIAELQRTYAAIPGQRP
ncbi:aminotransferase, class IV [Nocardioidaceae bacterium Broad-1]|nr:aminotransferase, class IV [Nocardioidaceae bacterium Broad-1]